MHQVHDGWYLPAKKQSCSFYNERPEAEISLLVIHCISLPEGRYGTGYVEQLFSGSLDCSCDESFEDLDGLEVSSHFFIDRVGEVSQFVSAEDRAWHAGISEFNGRQNCNDFSVGIELEGCDKECFSGAQYKALAELSAVLLRKYNIARDGVVGHSEIAPGRKTDPGPFFKWDKFYRLLDVQLQKF